MRRRIFTVLMTAVLLLGTGGAVLAWSPDDLQGSPYTGNFWLSTTSTHQAGVADWIRWNYDGLVSMRNDYDPVLDMTADCTENSPEGDRLGYDVHYTNVANFGVWVKNDWGSDSIKEECDLRIDAQNVSQETAYYYQVHFWKAQSGVSGEINISYQRYPFSPPPYHDHLDKVHYSQ